MTKLKNLTGQKFGRLTVIGFAYKKLVGKNYKYYWNCLCECGTNCIVESYNLKSGTSKSCGCYRKSFRKKHNLTKSRLYRIWRGIRTRCKNPKIKEYVRYGGRGIKVCDEWGNNFISFYNWAIENGYQDDLTIDRINNNNDYKPSNCRWVTMEEQSQNTKKVIKITYNNEAYSLSKWARIIGINRNTLYTRYKNGWNVEEMLTTKIGE